MSIQEHIVLDITEPLRLATGSHKAGSGKGCAMNVVSWENGDRKITDLPSCSDRMLARIVQRVNDTYCTHRVGDLLCPACSIVVLRLAHRTVGTTGHGLSDLDLRRVWVRVACRLARAVLPLASCREAAEQAVLAAEAWADAPSLVTADAASAYTYAAADAASASASASADTAAAYAAYASAYAYTAADAESGGAKRLRLLHLAIDEFYRLTGLTEHQPDPATTSAAIRQMAATQLTRGGTGDRRTAVGS